MKKVFFAGSFNPFTKGHADIALRLLDIFDFLTIGIGHNAEKPSSEAAARRNEAEISEWIARAGLTGRAEVTVYSGLTAQTAKEHGAVCMARGVRNAADFDYEYALAAANRDAFGIDTVLLPSDPRYSFISSSAIRDLTNHGRPDIADRYKA